MSQLNRLINEAELINKEDEILPKTVFVVKELDKEVDNETNRLYIFSSLDSAKNFVLRKIGEFKDNFLSSSRALSVLDDGYNYHIRARMWYFYLFYYEKTIKSFHIEEQEIRS